MNILQRLAKLASDLDKLGLFEEASTLDDIIKEAAPPGEVLPGPHSSRTMPGAPGAGGLSDPPPGEYKTPGPDVGTDFSAQSDRLQARKIQKIRKRFRILNMVRQEAGLSRKPIPSDQELKDWATIPIGDPRRKELSPFDRELTQTLSTGEFSGVLRPGLSPMALLRAVRDNKKRTFDFAKLPEGAGGQLGLPETGVAGKVAPQTSNEPALWGPEGEV